MGVVSQVKGYVQESVDSIRSTNIRQVLSQIISLCMIVTSALIIWKGLILWTGSESPVVVVLSGSMEPGFRRGDILFLKMGSAPVRAGEIVVFNIDGREIPIVHRVIKVHDQKTMEKLKFLQKIFKKFGNDLYNETKIEEFNGHHVGLTTHSILQLVVSAILLNLVSMIVENWDNNFGDDRLLYAKGQLWLNKSHIMGRAVGFLPYVGWVTIIMTEKPIIKYILIGALGLLVITSKE